MAITVQPPNTILLGGPDGGHAVIVNDIVAEEAITPGMLVELHSSTGAKYRKASAALKTSSVALNASMLNRGVDDVWALGELMEVGVLQKGSTWWGLIASGQNLAVGAQLESAGGGTLRALASGVPIAIAKEAKTAAFTGLTRIRAELI